MKYTLYKGLILLLFIPLSASAWSNNAHRVMAEIAWQTMTPQTRGQVNCLLRQFQRSWPRVRRFQQMATWPDAMKAQGVTAFSAWHFINQPFSVDTALPLPPIEKENGVWAVRQGIAVFTNDRHDLAMQAWFLAFISHIVGDLHQPLHAVTRVSRAHPQGDLGGNLFRIHYAGATNLHQLWDQSLGALPKTLYRQKQVSEWAKTLQQRYPKKYFGQRTKQVDPAVWAKESASMAKNIVYQLPENSRPSAAYIKRGQQVALEQIVLAGYRLANLLNHLLRNHYYYSDHCQMAAWQDKNSAIKRNS